MPGLRAVLEARAQAPGKRPPAVARSTVLRPNWGRPEEAERLNYEAAGAELQSADSVGP